MSKKFDKIIEFNKCAIAIKDGKWELYRWGSLVSVDVLYHEKLHHEYDSPEHLEMVINNIVKNETERN